MADRDLVVLTDEPLNAETRLEGLRDMITPAGRHYVRTHFPMPEAPPRIEIQGTRPRTVSLDEIRALPARALTVTLECAGNGRRFLEPSVPGEQWGLGAVGTARWTGATLRALLERAALPGSSVELLFRGADAGVPKDLGKRIAYERSLPLDVALREDVLVAYLMDGEPIPREHGGPLRLVVPGWYGMASVKWLASVTPLDRPFSGFYQKDRYVIEGQPLRAIAPRAVITSPVDGATIHGPLIDVRGYAWSGAAPIERVDIYMNASADGTPREADLATEQEPYAWRPFRKRILIELEGQGRTMPIEFLARATDAAGNTQPLGARRNALGYMNNAAQPVRLSLRS
jgi:DMSO/TMAO reductase YedYZ molybdopterin-dependent catalytic subunit